MNFFDLLPWLTGGSIFALVALAVLAPSVLQVAGNWLSAMSPLIKGFAEFVVTASKTLWAGFLDMADNGKSLIFVAAVGIAAYIGGYVSKPKVLAVKPQVIYEDCKGKQTVRTETKYRTRWLTRRPKGAPEPDKPDWRQELFGN